MVWKQATDTCAGTAAKYGAPDTKKISQLFSDTNVTDTVTIHESVSWQYQAHPCTGASIRISNPAQTFNYTIVSSAILGNRNITIPLLTTNDTLAVLEEVQTFSSGAKTFNDNILKVRNPANTFSYTLRSGAIVANREITLPLLTGNDEIVTKDFIQTLTNKTISSANNTIKALQSLIIAISDETTDLTTGINKIKFRIPYAFTITDVRGSLSTAATGGTLLTVDVNDSGTTILSTKLTFDASETTTTTAATQRVISDSSLGDDAEISIDIDAIGSTTPGRGLKVALIGYPT